MGLNPSPVTCPAATAAASAATDVDATIGPGKRPRCRVFNAPYGNRQDDCTPEKQDTLAAENLALAALSGRTG
jgi:hypothetical protein